MKEGQGLRLGPLQCQQLMVCILTSNSLLSEQKFFKPTHPLDKYFSVEVKLKLRIVDITTPNRRIKHNRTSTLTRALGGYRGSEQPEVPGSLQTFIDDLPP